MAGTSPEAGCREGCVSLNVTAVPLPRKLPPLIEFTCAERVRPPRQRVGRVPSCRAPCLSACRWPFPVGSGQAGGRGPAVLGALPGASLSPEAVIGPRSLGRRQMRGWKHGPLRGNRGRADLWGARAWAGHFAKGFTLTSHLTPITPLGAGRRSHRWETEAARHRATRQQGAGPGVEPRPPGLRWRNPAAPSATSDGRFTPGWLRMHPLATPDVAEFGAQPLRGRRRSDAEG